MILNPDLGKLWLRGLEDFDALEGEHRMRFRATVWASAGTARAMIGNPASTRSRRKKATARGTRRGLLRLRVSIVRQQATSYRFIGVIVPL